MSEKASAMAQDFIPLSIPNISHREIEYVTAALKAGWVSSAGASIGEFETKLASYVGAKYAVACQSGTAGLHVGLRLLGCGPDTEVVVPSLTFIAPVNAIHYVGAKPVFVDCDDSLNIDVEKLEAFCREECELTPQGLVNRRTSRRVAAIVPVHIFGNAVRMDRLMEIARQYKLRVIEDASESLGTRYTSGPLENRYTGTIGEMGVFSFNGNKIITTGGGGMIVTNDPALAKQARYLTTQAKDDEVTFLHNDVGYNYRLTNLQAAVGLGQLEQLEAFIETKARNYAHYARNLAEIPGVTLLGFDPGTRPNRWFYSLVIDPKRAAKSRDEVMKELGARGIQARPIWILNHLQKPYADCQAYRIEKAAHYWERVLNVPCSTNLSSNDVDRVCLALSEALKR